MTSGLCAGPPGGLPAAGHDLCCRAGAPAAGAAVRVSAAHPVRWRSHLDPGAISTGPLEVIARGAVTAGAAADAVVACDEEEQARRRSAGLGAVTSLWLLDALMTLPAGAPVRIADLSADAWACISAAPRGVVAVDGGWVTRLLSPPLTVVGAVVRGPGWRRPLRQAARFTPFAQRVLVLEIPPPSRLIWEAEVAGVGVWVSRDGELIELCPPEPFRQRYWKAAGWRFAERAYAASLSASPLPGWSPASADRPARTGTAGSGQRQPALPLR
ncbi:hypothetical protein EAS64_02435 [Trebonia kvetii]|uniref:Uncharacterized protein n=1 Tax=Trebonia kvetii TaxID=2480626 RepID=A0A6P2C4G7_9ACTN|nr:hypothetical protein [Trebonia kvetii]TVZ06309.1 hypothetical protein EAS64_02435 [Trebonia kvetii]